MVQDKVHKHLDNAMYGTPLVKPEEQKKYMGTFRERCYLTMTISQMKEARLKTALVSELKKEPEASVLLSGAITSDLQALYLKLLTETGTKFTIINDGVTNKPDSFGLIVAGKAAVNEAVVDIEIKYPKEVAPTKEPAKKSFWGKLFH